MTCRAVYTEYLVNYLSVGFNWMKIAIGDDGVVLTILGATSIVLVILFHRVQEVIVPRAAEWYKTRLLVEATNWFNSTGLRFIGFKFRTAVISVALGAAFYIMAKVALAFPAYLLYSLPLLAFVFASIAVAGFFVSGNVSDANRKKYFRRFYVPSLTGLSLIAVNLVLDLLINLAVAIGTLLQSV